MRPTILDQAVERRKSSGGKELEIELFGRSDVAVFRHHTMEARAVIKELEDVLVLVGELPDGIS